MKKSRDYISYDFETQSHWQSRTHHESMETVRTRLFVVLACFAVIFTVIGFRLIDVCLFSSNAGRTLAHGYKAGGVVARANITDRNGDIVAASLKTQSMYANAKVVLDAEEAASKLMTVFPELNEERLLGRLQSGKGFVWLVRHVTPAKQAEVMRLGIPGIYFQADERRVYPHGSLLAHVTGYVDIDNEGIAGIEKSMDATLRSNDQEVALSIDLRLQHILRDELLSGVDKFKAEGASGVILDVRTGEILAMASLPDFDPNRVGETKDPKAFFNRNTLGVYEMGSTFKIFNTAMVLDQGSTHLTKRYDVTQPLKVGRFRITDYHQSREWMNVAQIFVKSSNIGSAKLALEAGSDAQTQFFDKVGFFKEAKLEIPENGRPIVPKKWSEATTITTSYGYGLSVSPIQAIAAVSGIVNKGIMHKPTLLCAKHNIQQEGQRIVSEKTSEIMRKLLYMVVAEGTGRKAAAKGYWVGGKSGTANVLEGKKYKKGSNITSFIASFPMNEPQYLVLILVDQPKGIKETHGFNAAGWNAAPIAGKIIKRMAPLVNVLPVREDVKSPHNKMVLMEAKSTVH